MLFSRKIKVVFTTKTTVLPLQTERERRRRECFQCRKIKQANSLASNNIKKLSAETR
jgi:hypothetical protein